MSHASTENEGHSKRNELFKWMLFAAGAFLLCCLSSGFRDWLANWPNPKFFFGSLAAVIGIAAFTWWCLQKMHGNGANNH